MHVGTVIADRFRIDQLAGRGGMGAVSRARDLARDVDVAIKVGHVTGHNQARRMAREAQALHEHLRALRHGDIVEYVAHGVTADERVYLVMEWLEGQDLAARIAQGPLAEADVIALAWRLARTLSLVHGCGVVHRDIKPGIERLTDRNLVLPERQTPGTGEAAYRFRHDLVCDAAYAMLLEDDLVRAHRQAAVWLEQAGERDAFVLAEHYRRGRAPAQALPWYCRAAEQALAADDVQAVLRPVEHAVACGATGETLGALRLLEAEAQNWGSQHEAAYHAASTAMARLPHGSDAWAQAGHQLSWAAASMGDQEALVHVTEELAGLADPLTDAVAVAMAQCATHLIISGHRAEAGALMDRLATRAQAHVPSVAGAILHLRAFRAWLDGRMDLAAIWFGRAVEQWELAGNMRQACLDRINVGMVLRILGQYADSVAALRHSLDQSRRLGLEFLVSPSSRELALSLGRLGQYNEALELVRGAVANSLRDRTYFGIARAWLALLASRPAESLAELKRNLDSTGKQPTGGVVALVLAVRAGALLDLGRPHEALEATRASMDIVNATGLIEDGEALLRLVHAEALHATGRPGARPRGHGRDPQVVVRAGRADRKSGLAAELPRPGGRTPAHRRAGAGLGHRPRRTFGLGLVRRTRSGNDGHLAGTRRPAADASSGSVSLCLSRTVV
jgi:tetratricopeptide (TPR) repeat protein